MLLQPFHVNLGVEYHPHQNDNNIYYIVLWLSLLLYSFLRHVLAFSIMIWQSYKYVDLDVSVLCIDVPT